MHSLWSRCRDVLDADLKPQVELPERAGDFFSQDVHSLTLLEHHNNEGSLLLCLGYDLNHVETIGQLLQDFV